MSVDSFEKGLLLCDTHLHAGNNYVQIDDYKSAIQEFSKVIELLPEFVDLAIKIDKSNPPPEIKKSYFVTVRLNAHAAYMGRSMSYLATGEQSKAKADKDMADKIMSKNSLEEIKSELTGGGLAGCISIIVFIVLGYILFFR